VSEDYASVYGTAEYWNAIGKEMGLQYQTRDSGDRAEFATGSTINDKRKAMGLPEYDTTRGGLDIPEPPIRAYILDEAKQAVCSDRNAEYGEPIDNFGRWAGVCNSLGYRGPGGRELKPHDLAVISTAGKLSRAMQTPGKRDHSVDTAGYGSLIYELVTLEDQCWAITPRSSISWMR